jgi:hypothetical protein
MLSYQSMSQNLARREVYYSVFEFARMVLHNTYPRLPKKHKRIVMFWLKDDISVHITHYRSFASLKLGQNVVIDKVIENLLISADPLSKHSHLIFVVQIAGALAFTVAENIPRKKTPKDIVQHKVWLAAL